jgi:hypothetical protein
MTSAIVSATIDADFPVAGVDNDSQGFRDNFSIIRDGLATANAEITELQTNTAKLNDDNDFNGNVISNAVTNQLYGSVYTTTSTPTTNVSLNDGEYQVITIADDHTLTFKDWPTTDLYGKIRLELKSNGTERTVTFSTESGGVIRKQLSSPLIGISNSSKTASSVATTNTTFSFPTANINILDTTYTASLQVGDRVFGTGITGDVSISSITNLTSTASATTAPNTLTYTIIQGDPGPNLGLVTCSSPTTLITTGTKVQLSDNTGITGLSTSETYYAYGATGNTFRLASSLANASAGTPVSGLSGTVAYSSITVGANVKIISTFAGNIPNGNQVVLTDVTGLTGLTASPTVYYAYSADSTGVFLAASYADATAGIPVPISSATGTYTGTASTLTHTSNFSGTATASFPELDPSSNRLTVSTSTGMFVGMPIRFTGTGFGGVSSGTNYFVNKVIDSTGIRISTTLGGTPVTLSPASGSLSMVPRTVLGTTFSSQIVSSVDGVATTLTLTTHNVTFPTPFTVSSDSSKVQMVEAWTSNGGVTVYMKYLGEYA